MIQLPEKFEEFAEARRNGFIKVKELKEQGKKVAGVFCTYTPVEIPIAADIVTVGVCGVSEEPIKDAEKVLPRNLCPLIKSSYGHAITDTCPYIYFSDILIAETTCDGKKKMYEELAKVKNVHVMHLPNSKDGMYSNKLWENELVVLIDQIEKQFDVKITEDDLRRAIKDKNEERKLIKEFHELAKLTPPPMSGFELYTVLYNLGFKFDREESKKDMRSLIDDLKEKHNNNESPVSKDAKRILITGCPIGGVAAKVIKTIEESGAVVVGLENCGGIRANYELVDESNPNPIEALAKKYINIPCSCMSNNHERVRLIGEMIDEYQVDGVVDVVLQACHTFSVESYRIKEFTTKEKNTPYMAIETDYSQSDVEQLRTRFEAFIEMLDQEPCTV